MAHRGGPDLDGPAASVSQAVWKPEWPKGRTPKGNGDNSSGTSTEKEESPWPKGRTPKGNGDMMLSGTPITNHPVAEGQNAERQWRPPPPTDLTLGAATLVAEGQNAERQWRHWSSSLSFLAI